MARLAQGLGAAALSMILVACEPTPAPATPPISPGTTAAPREVNIIARDYTYLPSPVDLVPGETVLLHVINAGLVTHEAIIGDQAVQDAWEVAEAAVAGSPPGPTPAVSVPPQVAGLRIVVESGQRVDVTWTVPGSPASPGPALLIGCHIPGHLANGMIVPVRFATPDAVVPS